MSTVGRALKRPADFDSNIEDSEVVDLCSGSSGDEAARITTSTAADSDASHATVSEDSDSDADDASGATALSLAVNILNACMSLIWFRSCRRCCASCAAAAVLKRLRN